MCIRDRVYGMRLIVVGLIKKLILADSIAPYIDGVFGSVYTASGCLLYTSWVH